MFKEELQLLYTIARALGEVRQYGDLCFITETFLYGTA
jgi:hypothetical protein